jgi:hypothetical protein
MIEGFKDLATVVRSGRPLADQPFSGVEHPIWVEFARSMAPLLYLPAQTTAKLLGGESEMKVLDIAAGHGMSESPSLSAIRKRASLLWTFLPC